MLSIANDNDRREAKLRERKQQIELERRKRIFNVRNRVIGVDVPALEKQLVENELMRHEVKRIETAYNAQMQREGLLAYQLSLQEQQERRRINEEVRDFRKIYQRKENAREYDLNDPNALKKDIPPCDREDIGISAAQKFGNEDSIVERKRLMREQRNAWFKQQSAERKKWDDELAAAEKSFKQLALVRAERGMELEKMEKMCRKRVGQAIIQYNQAMAEEKRIQQAIEEENEVQDKKAEIYNNLTSGLLCEVHDMCASALGPNRIIGGAYKGMTPEERLRIRKDQIEQIALNKARRDEERLRELKWEDLSSSILHSVYQKDMENRRKTRETAMNVFKDNEALAAEQSIKKQHYAKLFGNNQPTDEFHTQFNKTTR